MIGSVADGGQGTVRSTANAENSSVRPKKDGGGLAAQSAVGAQGDGGITDTVAVSESAQSLRSRNATEDSGLLGGFALAKESGVSSLEAESPQARADKAREQAVFAPIQAMGAQANVDGQRAMSLLG